MPPDVTDSSMNASTCEIGKTWNFFPAENNLRRSAGSELTARIAFVVLEVLVSYCTP